MRKLLLLISLIGFSAYASPSELSPLVDAKVLYNDPPNCEATNTCNCSPYPQCLHEDPPVNVLAIKEALEANKVAYQGRPYPSPKPSKRYCRDRGWGYDPINKVCIIR